MNNWLKKVTTLIAGDPEEFQLEHRNLNGACFIANVGFVLALIINSFVDFPFVYNLTVIVSGMTYLALFYFSRVRKISKGLDILFLINSIFCLSVIWFLSQGIEGSSSFFYFDLFFISLTTFKTKKYLIIILLYVFCLIALIGIQYIKPSLIVPYESESSRFLDLSFSMIVTVLIFSYLVTSLKRNFETERTKVEKQKIEIEKQNMEIQEKNAELEEKQEEINAQNERILLQKIQLEKTNHNLIEADELKSRFFANISHEFRTPLTLIIGPLQSLIEKATDKELISEYSQMLKHSGRLLLLINQLLDISRIEKGEMQLALEETKLNSLIQTIISSYDSFAKEKGISFTLIEKANNINLLLDIDKFEKILYNLLSNAFKFTKNGGRIEVQLQMAEDIKNIEIIVKDSGIGIPLENIPHIFDRFYQVDGGRNREYEGTGIGLALTKELVELHKGNIYVTSTFGESTEFKVSLPLDKTAYLSSNVIYVAKNASNEVRNQEILDLSVASETSLVNNNPLKDKKTVLIVEDNMDMRNYLSRNLGEIYRIVEAKNGEEGIKKALEIQPDLILSDIMMPAIDGLQLTKLLKENQLTCHMPVILLTAKAGEESKLEGLEIRADDYITKPFSIKEVKARINTQIVNRQLLREKFEKTINVVPSDITASSLDEIFLRKALHIIEINLSNSEFSVDDLCKQLSMSRTNIHLKLKAITNQSTTEFIRSIRLKRAAHFIKQKAGTTAEIAYMVGFTNQQYFSRCFKEYFKVTPTDYQ